jgi:F-type H+-transporting ATPase subunit b
MEILRSLGVDWTLFIHLVCFGISYFFLTTFVLKPYAAAHHERERRTVGNEEVAARLIEEAHKLQEKYEQRARALNSEIKGYYDKSRTEAMEQYDQLVSGARAEANIVTKGAQAEVQREVGNARKALVAEIPSVAATIASKLAGKEISV